MIASENNLIFQEENAMNLNKMIFLYLLLKYLCPILHPYNNVRAPILLYRNHTGGIKETVGKIDFLYNDRTNLYFTYLAGYQLYYFLKATT